MERNDMNCVDDILINYFTNIDYEIPEFILKNTKRTIKNLNKDSRIVEVIKKLIITLIGIMILTSGVYAGVKYVVDKKNYSEKVIEKEDMDFVGYFTSLKAGALEYQDGIEYQIIDNYQKYLEVKEFVNIPDMSENDFNEYFLVFILPGYGRADLRIRDMETTEDTLKINVETREGSNNRYDEYVNLCTKVSNDMKREKIEVVYLNNKPNMSNYAKLDDVPYDYKKEQAIEDGCVVLDNGRFVTDKNGIKNFISRTQSGKNDNIRIVQYHGYFLSDHEKNLDGAFIIDIEFKNGKYIICQDYSRTIPKEENNENCKCMDINDFRKNGHREYMLFDMFVNCGTENEYGRYCLADGTLADEVYIVGEIKTNGKYSSYPILGVKN